MTATVGSTEFDFNVNANGSYSLSVNNQLWLQSGPTFFNGFGETWSTDSTDYPLVLVKVSSRYRNVDLEQWHETRFTYTLGNTSASVVVAIRLYEGDEFMSKVLFTQVINHTKVLNRKFHISQISHCEKLVSILHSA